MSINLAILLPLKPVKNRLLLKNLIIKDVTWSAITFLKSNIQSLAKYQKYKLFLVPVAIILLNLWIFK